MLKIKIVGPLSNFTGLQNRHSERPFREKGCPKVRLFPGRSVLEPTLRPSVFHCNNTNPHVDRTSRLSQLYLLFMKNVDLIISEIS